MKKKEVTVLLFRGNKYGYEQMNVIDYNAKDVEKQIVKQFLGTLKEEYGQGRILVGRADIEDWKKRDGKWHRLRVSMVQTKDSDQRLYYEPHSQEFYFAGEVLSIAFGEEQEFELSEECINLINPRLREIMILVAKDKEAKYFSFRKPKGGKTSL